MFFFSKSSAQSRIRSISFCGIAVFGTPKLIAMVFAPFWGLAPSWHHPSLPRLSQDKRCQVRQEFRGLLKLGQKSLRIQHRLRFFFLWSVNASQVRVRIKCGFKLLCVDLTILIQNMRIDFCNHVHLGVAGVTLCRFQIPVIQLQLVSRAAVSEGMKNNIGKVGLFLEPSEGVIDDGFLTRTAIRQTCKYKSSPNLRKIGAYLLPV